MGADFDRVFFPADIKMCTHYCFNTGHPRVVGNKRKVKKVDIPRPAGCRTVFVSFLTDPLTPFLVVGSWSLERLIWVGIRRAPTLEVYGNFKIPILSSISCNRQNPVPSRTP